MKSFPNQGCPLSSSLCWEMKGPPVCFRKAALPCRIRLQLDGMRETNGRAGEGTSREGAEQPPAPCAAASVLVLLGAGAGASKQIFECSGLCWVMFTPGGLLRAAGGAVPRLCRLPLLVVLGRGLVEQTPRPPCAGLPPCSARVRSQRPCSRAHTVPMAADPGREGSEIGLT